MAQGYRQKFGKRKAIKYRKYAADAAMDFARCGDKGQRAILTHVRAQLLELADLCDPPDPYEGL